ncbi:SOS response-associated peptidase [Pontivivens insulae]|uniref:Abasic site processing protein n=1 Tax=Pontivivens insulae TaxID=1639689 RepID=A0A2R8AC44_9RHOB|nr:SOS response-associated peptidase [Pontivivens insulae]RED11044.1 putative SOS response-associated peptidase YedK [Pontivivens insulae]SPF29781.1 Putative SOS response-associated peptidase YedK [Pontivivens insulae]
MCGRFALHPTLTEAVREFRVPRREAEAILVDNDDIRPTMPVGTVISEAGDRHVVPMRWGFLPDWYERVDGGPLLINARSETIAEKPAFRAACRARRCLIPMSGFYEWQVLGPRAKRVHWLEPAEASGGAFAGIWQQWTGPDGTTLQSCAIVTCAASDDLKHIHARLPLVIEPESYAKWLGEEGHGAARLMHPPNQGWWRVEPDRGPPRKDQLF